MEWWLSPAYDVTFTVNFKNRFIGDRHIMTIEECNRAITRKQFLRLGEENDVRNAELIINEIEETVLSFADKVKTVKMDRCFTELITQFIKTQTDLLK
ncbi:hypothetical protein [Parabacteroides sp.]